MGYLEDEENRWSQQNLAGSREGIQFLCQDSNGRNVFCELSIYPSRSSGRTLVIVSERFDNPGMSVTNAAELIAEAVCEQFNIHPERLVWVEHYPTDFKSSRLSETWDICSFTMGPPRKPGIKFSFRNPQWKPMRNKDWSDLQMIPPEEFHERGESEDA